VASSDWDDEALRNRVEESLGSFQIQGFGTDSDLDLHVLGQEGH